MPLQRAIGNQAVTRLLDNGSGSAGGGTGVVQRRFLDGAEDWKTQTTKRSLGRAVSRSKALKAIDKALADWIGRGAASPDDQRRLLGAVKQAIDAWRQDKGGTSVRDTEVDDLANEVDAEVGRLDREQRDAEKARKKAERKRKAKLKKKREEKKKKAAALKAQQEHDKKFKAWSEIESLTLKDLAEYMKVTPDWHTRSTLTDTERETARKLEPYGASAGARAFRVSDVAALGAGGSLDTALTALDAYLRAVEANQPFSLTRESTVAEAVKLGRALAKLSAAFPAWVLKTAIDDNHFRILVKYNLVDRVVQYYETSDPKPIFQAENGSDFLSYAQLVVNDHKDPLDYQATVLKGKIRNFHRFEKAALDRLIANYADTSKSKPLTLIVHAALDHNGAFHRDPQLTAVITNTHINALLVEGGETLEAYRSRITPLAQAYGMNNKIDQVMFAGHGNSRLIQMAGTVAEGTGASAGKLTEQNDAIDLHQPDEANKLFDEVLKNMDPKIQQSVSGSTPAKQANRRILFNACLTNSNVVPIALSEGKAKAKAEILDYISKNASLATYLQQRAEAQGKDVTSLGANASIGQVNLIEGSTGKLDLVSTADPKVTAPKLVYAEEGVEPGGVLRAALEAWAHDEAATLQAMGRRAARNSNKWTDAIIESMFTEVIGEKDNKQIATILQLYEAMAGALAHLTHDAECRVQRLASLFDPPVWLVDPILVRLATTPTFTGSRQIRLVLRQLEAILKPNDATVRTALITEMTSSGWDAKTVTDYLNVPWLAAATVLPKLFAKTVPTEAKMLLGIVGVVDHGAQADCKAYLAAQLRKAAPEIPGLPEVPDVPPVPPGKGPRAEIPEVPEVPGRKKVSEIPGHRAAVAMVPDLPELPALPAVSKGADAPGRPGRKGRAAVDKVPAVPPFFPADRGFERLVAGRKTEAQIVALVKP